MNPTTAYAVPQVGERVEFVEDYAPHAALGQRGVVTKVEDREDGNYALVTVHLDADQEPTVPAFAYRVKVVPAEDTLAEAPTYAAGDLVTVVSDSPAFQTSLGPCPSSAKKGDLYRVEEVWRDGDLTLQDPETGAPGSIVVSPQYVEPYVAPAIFIASTARQAGKTSLGEAWQNIGYVPADAFATFDEATDLSGYEQAFRAWGHVAEVLWTLPQAEPEVDDLDRRADALEEAIDLLGDDRLVEDYVAAARFILGEEV